MLVDPGAEMLRQHLRAEADAEIGLLLLRAGRRASRSRGLTISSSSLALCGPPKITAPVWFSSVFGNLSPKRGRRMSSGMSRLRSWMATRPGVESSPCRTIRTGRAHILARILTSAKKRGAKESCRKTRQSACQSYPVDARLQDRGRGADMPPRSRLALQDFGLTASGAAICRASSCASRKRLAARSAAPARTRASGSGRAPPPACRASGRDSPPRATRAADTSTSGCARRWRSPARI